MTTPLPTESPRRKKLTLGPGSLVLGSVGTQLDMSCQLTNVLISAEADSEDPEHTLCGDTVAGERTYAWTMAANVFQDIEKDGVIDYTWKYAGTEVPFKFVPDSTGTAAVTGRVTIDPIGLGGDVKTRVKSEIEWQIVGDPSFTPAGEGATEPTDPGESGGE